MEKKYINKWFTYNVCGNKIIVKVTGYDNSNKRFDGAHFIGIKTILFENGTSMQAEWAYFDKAFYSAIKKGIIKEFKF